MSEGGNASSNPAAFLGKKDEVTGEVVPLPIDPDMIDKGVAATMSKFPNGKVPIITTSEGYKGYLARGEKTGTLFGKVLDAQVTSNERKSKWKKTDLIAKINEAERERNGGSNITATADERPRG